MSRYASLIEEYAAGPERLRQSVAGISAEQLDAAPIPGKWSTRQVVCHIADFEPVYADRMKRVIAEDEPTFFGGDPDVFAARLAYAQRNVEEEIQLVEAIRRQMVPILRSIDDDDFQRVGHHAEDGPLTLETLLRRITEHIPHHVKFIEEKRNALGISRKARMECDLDTSIPDWIIDHPESAVVFDELRLDTSCAGKSLEYVCLQQGMNAEAVLRRLLEVVKAATLGKSESDEQDSANRLGEFQ